MEFTFYLIAFLIYLLILAYGSLNIRSNLYLKTISRLNTKNKEVVLTFNLYDSYNSLSELIDFLQEKDINALFFCTGSFTKNNTAILKRIKTEGHLLANLSFVKTWRFGFLNSATLVTILMKTDQLIADATGCEVEYFRPPYGITNPFIKKAVTKLGYEVIGWKLLFKGKDFANTDKTTRKARRIKPGYIISIDDVERCEADEIKRLLQHIEEMGYRFVLPD